jgi:hypothetical protein
MALYIRGGSIELQDIGEGKLGGRVVGEEGSEEDVSSHINLL